MSEETFDFNTALDHLEARTQAGFALIGGSTIDQALKLALQGKMVKLSKTRSITLFEGYGPLASFSARIDIAAAFGLISETERHDLLVIKRIRNAFAHALSPIDFSDARIQKFCSAFNDYKSDTKPMDQYLNAIYRIGEHLEKITKGDAPDASPDKSQSESHAHSPPHDENDREAQAQPRSPA